MISDATFRACVIGLLSVITLIMIIALFAGIATAVKTLELKSKIQSAVDAFPQIGQQVQNAIGQAGSFIQNLPTFIPKINV